jgi:hypothetical protein
MSRSPSPLNCSSFTPVHPVEDFDQVVLPFPRLSPAQPPQGPTFSRTQTCRGSASLTKRRSCQRKGSCSIFLLASPRLSDAQAHGVNSAISALASIKSFVSKPSVNLSPLLCLDVAVGLSANSAMRPPTRSGFARSGGSGGQGQLLCLQHARIGAPFS